MGENTNKHLLSKSLSGSVPKTAHSLIIHFSNQLLLIRAVVVFFKGKDLRSHRAEVQVHSRVIDVNVESQVFFDYVESSHNHAIRVYNSAMTLLIYLSD